MKNSLKAANAIGRALFFKPIGEILRLTPLQELKAIAITNTLHVRGQALEAGGNMNLQSLGVWVSAEHQRGDGSRRGDLGVGQPRTTRCPHDLSNNATPGDLADASHKLG